MGRIIGQVVHPRMGLCDKVIDEEYFLRITLPSTTDEDLSRILGEKVEFERVAAKTFRGENYNHEPGAAAVVCLGFVRDLQKGKYKFEIEERRVSGLGSLYYQEITVERLEAIAEGREEPFCKLVEATNPDFDAYLGDGE